MLKFIFLDLARDRRPRTDDAHFSTQHIEELRQLVKAVLPEEAADAGDAGIVAHLKQNAVALVHGSQILL